jgi:hypothetical protein
VPTAISVGAAVNLRPALTTFTFALSVLETAFLPFLAVTLTQYTRESYIQECDKMGICEVQNNGYIYEKSNEEATKI